MAKKTYAAQEVLDFVNNGWPTPDGAWYMDDVPFMDNPALVGAGKEGYILKSGVDPALRVSVDDLSGSLFWQGDGADPTEGDGKSFVRELDKFLKKQTHVTLTVQVPKHAEVGFKYAVTNTFGGKIIK